MWHVCHIYNMYAEWRNLQLGGALMRTLGQGDNYYKFVCIIIIKMLQALLVSVICVCV